MINVGHCFEVARPCYQTKQIRTYRKLSLVSWWFSVSSLKERGPPERASISLAWHCPFAPVIQNSPRPLSHQSRCILPLPGHEPLSLPSTDSYLLFHSTKIPELFCTVIHRELPHSFYSFTAVPSWGHAVGLSRPMPMDRQGVPNPLLPQQCCVHASVRMSHVYGCLCGTESQELDCWATGNWPGVTCCPPTASLTWSAPQQSLDLDTEQGDLDSRSPLYRPAFRQN